MLYGFKVDVQSVTECGEEHAQNDDFAAAAPVPLRMCQNPVAPDEE